MGFKTICYNWHVWERSWEIKWVEIPRPARHYILYYTIISPMLIVWYMLPVYLFMTGYTVLEVGIIYSIVHIASIPLSIVFGKLFEKISLRKGLVLIDALDGIAYTLYVLAYGPIAPITLFLGMLIEKFSSCSTHYTQQSRRSSTHKIDWKKYLHGI